MQKAAILFSISLIICSDAHSEGFWASSHVSESPHFETPEEACSWYLDLLGYDLISIEYRSEKFVNCVGQLRDLSRELVRNGVIGFAAFVGQHWNRSAYEQNAFPFCVDAEKINTVRQSLRDLYGSQVDDWIIGAKTMRLFAELIQKAEQGCEGLQFIPLPLTLPTVQLRSFLIYVLKNVKAIWDRQNALRSCNQTMHACLLASAVSLKTEFALAQVEGEVNLRQCGH